MATERGDYVFKVSEYSGRTFWISTEPLNGGISSLPGKIIGFELRQATTIQQAREVARYLNEQLGEIILVS